MLRTGNIFDGKVLAIPILLDPGGTVLEGDVPHSDVFAVAEVDEYRALAFFCVGQLPFFPKMFGVGGQQRSLTVNHTFSADRDILLPVGEQQAVEN